MDNKKQTANDFWQQLLSQAKDAATTAVEMAEDGISYAKMSRSVKDLQAEIDRQMKTLGELLYATHKGTPSDSSYIQEVLEYVDNLQDQRRGIGAVGGGAHTPALPLPSHRLLSGRCGTCRS